MLALDPTVWTWPIVVDVSGGPSSVRPWSWSGGQVMEEFFPDLNPGHPVRHALIQTGHLFGRCSRSPRLEEGPVKLLLVQESGVN